MGVREVDRQHIVRICREECIEAGYGGEAFIECVKECVNKYSSSRQ